MQPGRRSWVKYAVAVALGLGMGSAADFVVALLSSRPGRGYAGTARLPGDSANEPGAGR